MVRRELIRVGACAAIGLIIGIIAAISYSAWYYALIGPVYSAGTFYGLKLMLAALGGIGKTAGKSIFSSIAGANWISLLIIIVLMIISVAVILTFGWIIGIFVALKAVLDAYKTDAELASARVGGYDTDWESGGAPSGKKKKSKTAKKDEYDNTSW